MAKVDMSAKAVTTRLKRLSQLRRLGLSLQKAKLPTEQKTDQPSEDQQKASKPETRTAK